MVQDSIYDEDDDFPYTPPFHSGFQKTWRLLRGRMESFDVEGVKDVLQGLDVLTPDERERLELLRGQMGDSVMLLRLFLRVVDLLAFCVERVDVKDVRVALSGVVGFLDVGEERSLLLGFGDGVWVGDYFERVKIDRLVLERRDFYVGVINFFFRLVME